METFEFKNFLFLTQRFAGNGLFKVEYFCSQGRFTQQMIVSF